jgi:hypothetical protein
MPRIKTSTMALRAHKARAVEAVHKPWFMYHVNKPQTESGIGDLPKFRNGTRTES